MIHNFKGFSIKCFGLVSFFSLGVISCSTDGQKVGPPIALQTPSVPCTTPPPIVSLLAPLGSSDATCGIDLRWLASPSQCPGADSVTYNVYRSQSPSFVPSLSTLVATGVEGLTFKDTVALSKNTSYYYMVVAEDALGNSSEAPPVGYALAAQSSHKAALTVAPDFGPSLPQAPGGQYYGGTWTWSAGSLPTVFDDVQINYVFITSHFDQIHAPYLWNDYASAYLIPPLDHNYGIECGTFASVTYNVSTSNDVTTPSVICATGDGETISQRAILSINGLYAGSTGQSLKALLLPGGVPRNFHFQNGGHTAASNDVQSISLVFEGAVTPCGE